METKRQMDLQLKRKLDHFLGVPLMWVLNAVARALGSVLRRNHAVEPVRKVLVMKFQGMGSLVIAKPALARLRAAVPGVRVVFWGSPSTCALAREMPEFDEVIVLNDSGVLSAWVSIFTGLLRIWAQRIDWVFDLEIYSKLSSVLATLTCGRNRAGFAVESVRFRKYAHTHLVFFNRYGYLGQAYERLLGLVSTGIADGLAPSFGPWRFDPVRPARLPEKYVVLNPHAGELSLERKWPQAFFEKLARGILDALPGYSLVLIGHGKKEIAENGKFLPHSRLVDLSGKISLRETIECLHHAALVVSNDSAPLHLALTGKAAVLGLFGPTQPETYLPTSRARTSFLTQRLYCSPCVHHWDPPPCQGDNQCMKRIRVGEVLAQSLELLGIAVGSGGARESRNDLENPGYYPGLVYDRSSKE